MFRKTWKQLKFLIILIIIAFVFPRSFLPHITSSPAKKDFVTYQKQNESEHRLLEYKDNEEVLRLKLIQLDIINASRKKSNSSEVKLDILASRVANKMSKEAAENNYVGHWNMAGEKPYMRYGFAGGYDHVTENAYGAWSSDIYDASISNIGSMMKSGHETFMAERAPNDGHKKNILDKEHNFVGIGYHISENQFRYYEEFIDRYFEFENIPNELRVEEPGSITVNTDGEKYIYYMIIYREKLPLPMTTAQIKRKGSYQDFTNEVYIELAAWELAPFRNGNSYKIPLTFSKEGLYYIQIFYDKKEIVKPTSLSTEGKTAASGIVINVTK